MYLYPACLRIVTNFIMGRNGSSSHRARDRSCFRLLGLGQLSSKVGSRALKDRRDLTSFLHVGFSICGQGQAGSGWVPLRRVTEGSVIVNGIRETRHSSTHRMVRTLA